MNYEDDNVETQSVGKSDAEYKSDISNREKEVTKALNMGKPQDALAVALADPPIYTKTAAIKDQNATIVLNLLGSFKEKDVETSVESLNDEQLDVLMKYVYRGLAVGENSAIFFKWHECVLKKGGMGTIIRVISEKKTV
ncbi:p16-arc [Dictyostelium purpureum]|uniref:Actin-related protein 2/3 complex subunit 5 n=1 Tax=Dictyostelium purpureum TaxID=5786 RepID=F1A489_DICPU|nr:p16-arc [Dictyostelium purpureum]EGC28986.1 p16-arc [Dictyostelium purpureum]|eukprot:XP_003294483.1 p16-arc [Dictyostelium purpureum]